MEKLLKLTLLYDFYGNLLTDKQKQTFEMYYLSDYSLSEISEEFNTKRQSVHNMLKTTEEKLLHYDSQLGLLDKYLSDKEKISIIKEELETINKENQIKDIDKILNILSELE